MPNEEKIKEIAEIFKQNGFSLVMVAAFTEEDLIVRCFSTAPKSEVYGTMESVSENLSLMQFDLASMINGDFIVKSPSSEICELAQWGADELDREEPMILACTAKNTMAVFGVGDVPMLNYMATRMMTSMRNNGDVSPNPFIPSMN